MNKFTASMGFLGMAASSKIIFTEMPPSIPGNFTTYQYDLETKHLSTIATGAEGSYTAWDFLSGAAVCGNTYYAAIDDSIIDWGLTAISIDTGDVRLWNSKLMPTNNLLHNLWCDPSGDEGSLLSVQSTTGGAASFGLYSVHVDGNRVTQEKIGDFPPLTDQNSFMGFDTEFQVTPDRSQVWGNFGSNTANSRVQSGNLHIMNSKTGSVESYSYGDISAYPYTSVPLSEDESFLTVVNKNGNMIKSQGSLSGDSVDTSDEQDGAGLYTGSQPWTVDAGSNKIYAITSTSVSPDGAQFLDIMNAKTGDIEQSVPFTEILGKKCNTIGGFALL